MLKKINDFFKTQMAIPQIEDEAQKRKRLAIATGVLLLEMAHSDSEFNDMEQESILSILQEQFNLTSRDAGEMLALSDLERKESLDLWQFTNLINKHYSRDEKIYMLEILWRVVYADGKVDKYEEYLMRRLNMLLNLDHADLIDTKLRVRDGE